MAAADEALGLSAPTQEQINNTNNNLLQALTFLFERANTKALQDLLTFAQTLDKSWYTPVTTAQLTEAISAAQQVLANEDALQEAVNQAHSTLNAAMQNLVLKANKTMLAALIAQANQAVEQTGLYVPSTITGLADLLDGARLVFTNENASQAETDGAAANLNSALAKLRLKANTANLERLYELLATLDTSLYTTATAGVFTSAMQTARNVLALSSEEQTQSEVDAAFVGLQAAYANLVLKSAEELGGNQNNGGGVGGGDDGTGGGTGGSGGTSGTGSNTGGGSNSGTGGGSGSGSATGGSNSGGSASGNSSGTGASLLSEQSYLNNTGVSAAAALATLAAQQLATNDEASSQLEAGGAGNRNGSSDSNSVAAQDTNAQSTLADSDVPLASTPAGNTSELPLWTYAICAAALAVFAAGLIMLLLARKKAAQRKEE
jgi:hypothetical protein